MVILNLYVYLLHELHIFFDGLIGKGSNNEIEDGGDERQNPSKHLLMIKFYDYYFFNLSKIKNDAKHDKLNNKTRFCSNLGFILFHKKVLVYRKLENKTYDHTYSTDP